MQKEKRTSKARGHHYIPQCYLKNFTQKGDKKSELLAIDTKNKKKITTTPKNVGKQRDFNRVEIENLCQNFLEQGLSHFENQLNRAIQNIHSTHQFQGKDREIILTFIALLATRNPYRREYYDQLTNDIAKFILKAKTVHLGEKIISKNKDSQISFHVVDKNLQDFANSEQWKCNLPRNEHIRLELSTLKYLTNLLKNRKWILCYTTDNIPFITSDCPITLTWNDPKLYKAPPGYGCPDTTVSFPFSKTLALIGSLGQLCR